MRRLTALPLLLIAASAQAQPPQPTSLAPPHEAGGTQTTGIAGADIAGSGGAAMDCTHLTSAGPHPGIGKPLRDYCARHPSPPAYSAHHERELAQHRHALARLQSRPRTAEGDQEIVREQARIDTLTRARADHLGNLRAADELHRARFGARPGPNPLPPARSLHPSPTTHLSSPGPAPVRASMPHGG